MTTTAPRPSTLDTVAEVVRRVAAADGADVARHYPDDDAEHVFPVTVATVKQATRLAPRLQALRALDDFLDEIASGDCYRTSKALGGRPCGVCLSCRARALRALIDREA